MFRVRIALLLLFTTPCGWCAVAQRARSPIQSQTRSIDLNVVVADKSGAPTSGLRQQDFTILENGVPQDITSFEAINKRHGSTEVILVLDAVNTGERDVTIEREEIKKFLKIDSGRLAYLTRVAVLTDKGLQIREDFSQDGNAITSALDHYKIPLRSIGRDADHGGAADRFNISFAAFAQLVAEERNRPGRKLMIWLSPGWPLLSREIHNANLREQIFGNLVELSQQLQQGQITVYSVDPSAIGDIDPGLTDPPTVHMRLSKESGTVEQAKNPSDVGWRNLALDVIAVQSGGLALNPGNDIAFDLRRCIADASAYYELSFNRVVTDHDNEYHRLDVRVAQPALTARTRFGYYSQASHAGTSTAEIQEPADASTNRHPPSEPQASAAATEASSNVGSHLFIDESLRELVERIPALKALQPVADQQQLTVILQNVGSRMDDFMRNIGDLIANEDITQEKLNEKGRIEAKERVQDSYLILHHGYDWGANAEYRMDENGNRLGPIGLERGYLVTSGYALSCISFSTVAQGQSRFRYLGDQRVDSRETYVLAFAQQPGQATFFTTMAGTGGPDVNMLTQGILWVEKSSFQIIRMRSDLLFPSKDLRLDQLTTQVKFTEAQLRDVPKPLWLPEEVDVYIQIGNQEFRNIHHYTNYRRYRVSTKVIAH